MGPLRLLFALLLPSTPSPPTIQLGTRPFELLANMSDSPLKDHLTRCAAANLTYRSTPFSIGHRGGATLALPEHSIESNLVGARMGASILECDVVATADGYLVCRHSQCDLHTTTDIVAVPMLNKKCTVPFRPAGFDKDTGEWREATAKCCTSDVDLAEFKSLCARIDGYNASATTPRDFLRTGEEYTQGTLGWRAQPYAKCGTPMSLAEHIVLVRDLCLGHSPELKLDNVKMPLPGRWSRKRHAQRLVDMYRAARVPPEKVWLQSFALQDVQFWLEAEPRYAAQAMLLLNETSDALDPGALVSLGVRNVAPSLSMLLSLDGDGKIVPSVWARELRAAGLNIVTWTVEKAERQVRAQGERFYDEIASALHKEGDVYEVLDVLARGVGVKGVFSDWAATVTFFSNCLEAGFGREASAMEDGGRRESRGEASVDL
jgi:glycerophosphoryl diester phosphodiesterase